MRALCVAHDFPFPTDNGSSVRVAGMLSVLAGMGDVRLIVNPRPTTSPADVAAVRALGVELQLGDRPMTPVTAKARLWTTALRRQMPPWNVMWFDESLVGRILDGLDWATHVIALDDFAAQCILHLPRDRGPLVVADKHLIYAAPNARGATRTGVAALRDRVSRALARVNERRVAASADVLIVTSAEEAERCWTVLGVRPDAVIPSAIDVPAEPWDPSEPHAPDVVWVGDLAHRPNREGLLALLREIRTRFVDAPPPFRLLVVGRGADDDIHDAVNGVPAEIVGYVPDLNEVIRSSSAAVITVWTGGGVRLKVLHLLGSGIPVAVSRPALEGTGAVDGEHCLAADDNGGLLDRLLMILADQELAAGIGPQGRRFVTDHHGWRSREPAVRKALTRPATSDGR